MPFFGDIECLFLAILNAFKKRRVEQPFYFLFYNTTMMNIQFTDLIEPVLHLHRLGRTLFVESGGFMVARNMRRVAETTVFIAENLGVLFLKEGETVAAVTVWDPEMVRWLSNAASFNANQFHERVEELKRNGAMVAKGEYRFFVEELQDAQTPYESE